MVTGPPRNSPGGDGSSVCCSAQASWSTTSTASTWLSRHHSCRRSSTSRRRSLAAVQRLLLVVLAATGPWRPRARPARRDEGRALGLAVHTPGGVEIIEMLSVSYPSRAASAPNQTHRRQHGLTINPPSFFEVGSPIQYIFPQHPKRTLRHGGHYAPNAISRSFTMARVCLELRPRPSRCVRAPNSGGRRIMRCNSARRSVVT